MIPQDDSLAECLARLSEGDQAAAREIYERFVHHLVQLAAQRLDRRLGARADPESVAHSVFESFFGRQQAGEFTLQNWGMVFGLLSHITFRKCLNRNRDLLRAKRGGKEVIESLQDWTMIDTNPGPAEVTEVTDLLTQVLSHFDGDEREVLDAFLEGSTSDAVATKVRLSVRTVQRIIERFRKQLMDRLQDR